MWIRSEVLRRMRPAGPVINVMKVYKWFNFKNDVRQARRGPKGISLRSGTEAQLFSSHFFFLIQSRRWDGDDPRESTWTWNRAFKSSHPSQSESSARPCQNLTLDIRNLHDLRSSCACTRRVLSVARHRFQVPFHQFSPWAGSSLLWRALHHPNNPVISYRFPMQYPNAQYDFDEPLECRTEILKEARTLQNQVQMWYCWARWEACSFPTRIDHLSDRQTTSFIEVSIEAGILLADLSNPGPRGFMMLLASTNHTQHGLSRAKWEGQIFCALPWHFYCNPILCIRVSLCTRESSVCTRELSVECLSTAKTT